MSISIYLNYMYKFILFSFIFMGLQSLSAQCISGNCENGQGVMDYGASVGKYEGEFKDGKREGFGIMYYADGRKWEGKWQKNAFKGGITTEIPYHSVDELRAPGHSDKNEFTDALYRILSTIPNNFTILKGAVIRKELAYGYAVWEPKVLLPGAKKGEIYQASISCKYEYLTAVDSVTAYTTFEQLSKSIHIANPNRTWKFDDLSDNPAFPLHRKLLKWTIATPATIRLELKTAQQKGKFDVYVIFTP